MAEKLIVGVDGGQSTTLTVVVARSGEYVGHFVGGPCNNIHEPGGLERQFSVLREGVVGALRAAELDLESERISSAVLGLSGSGHLETVRKAIPAERIMCVNDAVTALAGAVPSGPAVLLIAGTGSIALGRTTHGKTVQVGGWGPIAGDQGSGYDIGLRTIRAAFASTDGRLPETVLTELVLAHLGCPDIDALHRELMAGAFSHDRLASVARLASTAADLGDKVALAILEAAVDALVPLPLTALKKLGLCGERVPIVPVGGVITGQSRVWNGVMQRVKVSCPAAYAASAELGPALGAALLAFAQAGIPVTDAVLTQLKQADKIVN